MDELLNQIGANEGDRKPFDEWVTDCRSAGLQPNMVQRLKRMGKVYTELDPVTGAHFIVRGARPQPEV